MNSRTLRAPRATVQLATASLGPNALPHGAAELALKPIPRDPRSCRCSNNGTHQQPALLPSFGTAELAAGLRR
jgi:hypothetical protein